jgi:cardiolipin synthase
VSVKLLVDATEFWPEAERDIAAAGESLVVQALTFENDGAGGALARAIHASPARDRRILVDSHSRHVVSDKLWRHPKYFFDAPLHAEVRATRAMIDEFTRCGIGFRYVNPVGAFLQHAPARNHKKLVALDRRVAYIGGINFGDHNFSWHDIMLRIEDPDIAQFLAEDFEWTWRGLDHGTSRRFPGIELHVLNGCWNESQFAPVFDLIASARDTLYVQAPYLGPPFSEKLVAACERGVKVTIVTPSINNWKLCQDHILWKATRAPLDLQYYTARMTHMKAMLVDGHTLVTGSANFELWSYHFQQEYLAVVTDPTVVADFERRIVRADAALCVPCTDTVGAISGRLADLRFDLLERVALLVSGRTAEPELSSRAVPALHSNAALAVRDAGRTPGARAAACAPDRGADPADGRA